MLDRGDFKSRIWITEVGAEAQPASSPDQPPSQPEIDQAYYLNAIYSGILDNSELHHNVAHVFWFKYEDFVPGDYTDNYGLVRLAENDTHNDYSPTGAVYIHKLAYKTYQELALGYTSPTLLIRPTRPPSICSTLTKRNRPLILTSPSTG